MCRSAFLLAAMLMTSAVSAQTASGCRELPDSGTTAIRYDVNYANDILPLMQFTVGVDGSGLCQTCHISGGSANLNLGASFARELLIVDETTLLETGRRASGQPTPPPVPPVLRVKPGDPARSLLFLKINCASPGVGSAMPSGTLEFQALVHDWIAAGAIMPPELGGDRISIGNFESITRAVLPP
ncbi:MAG: hypothetical protein LW860_13850 [Xanthomonadaceae bacterium]|jgi:hypothetical protein|nr:hypothetical protein [Xanthomonadaceae bacterium]